MADGAESGRTAAMRDGGAASTMEGGAASDGDESRRPVLGRGNEAPRRLRVRGPKKEKAVETRRFSPLDGAQERIGSHAIQFIVSYVIFLHLPTNCITPSTQLRQPAYPGGKTRGGAISRGLETKRRNATSPVPPPPGATRTCRIRTAASHRTFSAALVVRRPIDLDRADESGLSLHHVRWSGR